MLVPKKGSGLLTSSSDDQVEPKNETSSCDKQLEEKVACIDDLYFRSSKQFRRKKSTLPEMSTLDTSKIPRTSHHHYPKFTKCMAIL